MANKRISDDAKVESVRKTLARFLKMDSARSDWESEWHYSDIQTEAKVQTNAKGKLMINISVEKVLNEINKGKYAGAIDFDVIWWQDNNDVSQTQPIYFALQDYLDREWFYQQKSAGIHDKWQYGTMVMYNGIRYDSYVRYEPKEVFDGIFTDDMTAIKRIEYKYTPINQSIYTSWFDDQAMNQWDYRKAEDCIIEEQLTVEAAKERWNFVEWVDINDIKPYAVSDPIYWVYNSYPNQCIIRQKYNRITWDRDVILNRSTCLYSWKYYHNGDLPVSACQHFPNNNSIYGDGIPKRIRWLKWYKKSILQDILDASKMSAWINMIVPQNTEVKWKVSSGINIWETNASAGMVQPLQMQTKIADMSAVISIIDDLMNVEVWENMRAPYSSPKTTLGEIQIMEEHQQIRDRTIDESLNIFYDDILTKTAINLTKYAVTLEKKTEKKKITVDGKEQDISIETFPNLIIKVRDNKIEDKKDKNGEDIKVFKESFGDIWYFDLDKSMCKWEFLVKVVTPSTRFSSTTQQNAFTQAISNLNILSQVFASMWINITDEIKRDMNPSSIIARFKQLYDFDMALVAKTKKSEIDDSIRQEQDLSMAIMGNSLAPTNIPNEQTNQQVPPTNTQQTQPQAVPEAKPAPFIGWK